MTDKEYLQYLFKDYEWHSALLCLLIIIFLFFLLGFWKFVALWFVISSIRK